jgi:alpha-mannosidase
MHISFNLTHFAVLIFFILSSAAFAQENKLDYFRSGFLDIVSSSHQDIAWMDTPQACEDYRINHCILPALEMMRRDPHYHFTMENMLNLMEFLDKHPELKSEIYKYMREGRFEWGATYNQPYESLLSGEELVRELYFGKRWLLKNFPNCNTQVAFTMDVPGRAMQMQQILFKAGVPYLMISRFHEGLHLWRSPDGSGVIAYSPGHYGNPLALLDRIPKNAVQAIEQKLDQEGQSYQKYGIPPDYMLLHTNDFAIPVNFNPLITLWNDTVKPDTGITMQYSSARTFFNSIAEAKESMNTITGERPNVWLYIHGPTHHHLITAKREAAVQLPQAEIFQTIKCILDGSFKTYPQELLNKAWMAEIYPDHGFGGNNGNITDEIFKEKEEFAGNASGKMLKEALHSIASRIAMKPASGSRIAVFNGLSWKRSSPITLPISLEYGKHYLLKDARGKLIPFQLTTLDQPDEINVATPEKGAHAEASSFVQGNGPEKTIDGKWTNDQTDRWVSSDAHMPQWVRIDFGKSRNICHVSIRHEGSAGIFNDVDEDNTSDFTIQGSNSPDGPWINLAEPITDNRSVYSSIRFAPHPVRYLRLFIRRSSAKQDQPARIFEIQAFVKNSRKQLHPLFVTDSTPSVGYSTCSLVPTSKKSVLSIAGVHSGKRVFQNRFYRIELAPGGVKSLYDRTLKLELLHTEKFLGMEVFTMQSVGTGAGEFGAIQMPTMEGFDKLSSHSPIWKLVENGPVRTSYEFDQPLPHCTVRERLLIYNTIKRIDCQISLLNWDGEKYREFRMALPVNMQNGNVAYAVPMGVDEVGKSEIKTNGGFTYAGLDYWQQCADIHPREVQDFIDASDPHFGVTMSSSVAVCDYIDPTPHPADYPILQPILLASRRSCNGTGNWYLQPGDHDYQFSIFAHQGNWRNGYKNAYEVTHPLLPVITSKHSSSGNLPLEASFLSVTPDNVVITTMKKCEDDSGVVIRACEMEGKNVRASFKSMSPILGVQHTDILEMNPTPLKSSRNSFSLRMNHNAIETMKIKMEKGAR